MRFWSPFGLHGGSQAGAKMALFLRLFFRLILEAFYTQFGGSFWLQKRPLKEARERTGEPSFSSTWSTKTSLQAPPAHPANASQNCSQKSFEKGTKMMSPGAPKMTQKWQQKWSWKSLQFWGAWELPRRRQMTSHEGPKWFQKSCGRHNKKIVKNEAKIEAKRNAKSGEF